jgi:hypothetical protein
MELYPTGATLDLASEHESLAWGGGPPRGGGGAGRRGL